MSLACADRLLLGGEAADAGDRAEGLLVAHRHLVGDAGEHGRREELAAELVRLAAEQHLGAALARVGDVPLDLLERRHVDQRADVDAVGEAVGDRRGCATRFGEAVDELVVDGVLDEDAVGRDAGLARVAVLAGDGAVDRPRRGRRRRRR